MPKRPLTFVLLAATLFLTCLLFTPTGIVIFLPGDVRIYLLNAARMLQGQFIYKDFFQFTPPGTEIVYFVLFKLFGTRAWIPNAVMLVAALSIFGLSVFISRRVMSGWAVFLPGSLFLCVSTYHGLDPSHHWMSIPAVLCALALILNQRTPRRMAAVGALCGLASFFTLARGLLACVGFATFLIWERRRNREAKFPLLRRQACLAGSFLSTLIATSGHFVWRAGLSRFVASTIIFGIRYYPADRLSNTFRTYLLSPPALRPWYGLPWVVAYLLIHVLVPGAYILFAVRYWKEHRNQPEYPWDRLMLVNLAGLFLFFSVANAPSYFRLCVVSLPALIISSWFLSLPGNSERVLMALVWTFVFLMAAIDVQQVQRHAHSQLNLPSGRTAFVQSGFFDKYRWLLQQTHPREWFFEAGWANSYVALALQDPTPVPFVTNTDYTRPEQVQDVLKGLEIRHVHLVLWSLYLDNPQSDSGAGDHLAPLRAYLRAHYRVIHSFADGDQVWERTE